MPTQKKTTEKAEGRDSRAGLLAQATRDYSESISRFGGSFCDSLLLLALSDEGVQRHFLAHAKGELFMGAQCPPGPGPVDEAYVLFAFRVLPPAIGLLPVFFLVTLNTLTGKVLEIVDPYTGGVR